MKKELTKFLDALYDDPLNGTADDADLRRIETVSPSLNWALSGGIVPGRFYVLTGPEGSGKSMFTMSCVAALMKDNPEGVAIWFDAERSYTNHWEKVFFKGDDYKMIENKQLIVRRTQTADEIFDYFTSTVMDMVDNGLKINACVVDSIQQIIGPKEEGNESVTKATMSDLASFLPVAMRRIAEDSRAHKIPWFFVAQVRDNFAVSGQKYVSREDKYAMTGGHAFKHCIDVTLLLEGAKGKKNALFDAFAKNITDDQVKVGHLIRGMVLKNRLGPCFRRCAFMFEYANGVVHAENELAQLALMLGIVKVEGRSYMLGEDKIAVGSAPYVQVVIDNEVIRNRILDEVRKTYAEGENETP